MLVSLKCDRVEYHVICLGHGISVRQDYKMSIEVPKVSRH